MWKLIKWSLLTLVVVLICSEIDIKTSLYKASDNSLEIRFPQWRADAPWFYVYWTPGTLRWQIEEGRLHEQADDL